ncbi:ABC transporter permease, partial [Exiguobacterium artemiae]|nr:ABC transporter permease [Exiguobacterium artemiae]
MPDIVLEYAAEIRLAIGQTFVMVGISILAALLLGLPLGTWLYLSRKGQLLSNQFVFSILNLFVNTIRS